MARHHHSKKAMHHKRALEHEMNPHERYSRHSEPKEYRESSSHRDGGMILDRHRGSSRNEDMYASELARRHYEMQEAGMIHDDMNAIANLPQEVMIKPYPKAGSYLPEELDDTIEGVDHQMGYDDSQRARNFYPKKV